MHDKDTAELAVQIVIAAIQNGGLVAGKADAVCDYYSAIYTRIASCDDSLSNTRNKVSESVVLSQ